MLKSSIEVQEFVDDNDVSPFEKRFIGLNAQAAAKVTANLVRMASGDFSNSKSISGGCMNAELILARGTECISERMGKRSSFYLVVEPRKNNRSIFKRLTNFGGI